MAHDFKISRRSSLTQLNSAALASILPEVRPCVAVAQAPAVWIAAALAMPLAPALAAELPARAQAALQARSALPGALAHFLASAAAPDSPTGPVMRQ